MRIVLALGGNALLRRGEPLTEDVQQRNVEAAAAALAPILSEHEVVITHGNGPQVGLLALVSDAYKEVAPYGLDVLGAESQGVIGFLLEQALRNAVPTRVVATLLTTVRVAPDDPAFLQPRKPVGPVYSENVGREMAAARGWQIAPDGAGFRRVVPSPRPLEILEIEAIGALLSAGVLTICAGGGGVPLVRTADGRLSGVEGVVDKDTTSALLAEAIGADLLLLLTDVAHVEFGWQTPDASPIEEITATELRQHHFAPGSMGPKVDAACSFVERTGRRAAIGDLADASCILTGRRGTQIRG